MVSITRATALAAGALTIMASSADAQSSPRVSESESDREAVLIGASYAHGWGTPQLPGHTLTNLGIGGEETSAMLARFDTDVIAAAPDAVIIWGHINDIFRAPGGDMAGAAGNATENLRQMIERARAAGIEPILVTELTMSRSRGLRAWAARIVGKLLRKTSYQERVNTQVRDVNRFLRAEGDRLGLLVLDFEAAVDDGRGYRRAEFTTADGSHVSEAGYEHLTAYARSAMAGRDAR